MCMRVRVCMSVLVHSSDGSDQSVAKEMREALEDLLVKHQVDLCLYGHHHSYQVGGQVGSGSGGGGVGGGGWRW